ncbi:MAG: zinc ribbon domain-containing protein [Clostridia bacterium]|nr:zinc ribbon domain-containing protein [Clostridia bacterium]
MICPNCGKELEGNFCGECGFKAVEENVVAAEENTAVTEEAVAPAEAPAEAIEEAVAVEECQAEPTPEVAAEAAPEFVAPAFEEAAPKKKSKAGLIIGIIVAVLVVLGAAAAAFFFFFFNKGTGAEIRSMYIKDNALYLIKEEDDKQSVLVAENLFEDEDKMNFFYFSAVDYADGEKKVYYPQKINPAEDSFSLYCKSTNGSDDPVKLAEDVVMYSASDDGKYVVYLDTEGGLYLHNMSERKKISEDVDEYWIADDFSRFAFVVIKETDDDTKEEKGDLYIQPIDGEKNKIDSDITNIVYSSANLDEFRYIKGGTLYVKKDGVDKVKIDTDVATVVYSEENGAMYYTKKEDAKEKTGTLYDFVTDPEDLIQADESLSYYSSDYKTWNEALYRKWAREGLKNSYVSFDTSVLYYYNGETSVVVNKSYVSYDASSDGTLIITSYDDVKLNEVSINGFVDSIDEQEHFRENLEKYNKTISKVEYLNYAFFDEFRDMIVGAYESGKNVYLVKNGETVAIDNENGENFKFDDAGNVYYYTETDAEKKIGDIHFVKIEKGAVVSDEVFDSDVYDKEFSIFSGIGPVYRKEYKEGTYDLYANKTLVAYDVSGYRTGGDKKLIVTTDYDSENYTGSIWLWENGEKVKIADDVATSHIVIGEDDVIYYYLDYSAENNRGDLYGFKDGESIRIDYDVVDVFNVILNGKYRLIF